MLLEKKTALIYLTVIEIIKCISDFILLPFNRQIYKCIPIDLHLLFFTILLFIKLLANGWLDITDSFINVCIILALEMNNSFLSSFFDVFSKSRAKILLQNTS